MSGIAISLLLIWGCGYRVNPGGEHIDKSIQTVFVENITNKTSEAHVENMLRSALINEFIKGRRFKLADGRESADALCRGSIETFATSHLAYSKDNLVSEERITLTVNLILEERASGKILWTDKDFSAKQDYQWTDINTKGTNRKFALIKLSNDLAEKAYRFMMSDF
jgi:hypothetical protein